MGEEGVEVRGEVGGQGVGREGVEEGGGGVGEEEDAEEGEGPEEGALEEGGLVGLGAFLCGGERDVDMT